MRNYCKAAFTLIELSIVLIIIGLLVGGVLAGRALIDAGKVQAQVQQLQQIQTAYYTFISKYDAIPGDMDIASSFWPGATDGNDDGFITSNSNNIVAESRTLFEHIELAGLYDAEPIGTQRYPATKLDSAFGMMTGTSLEPAECIPGNQVTCPDPTTASVYLNVSNPDAVGSLFNDSAATFSPVQLANLDSKLDDGVAREGKFRSFRYTQAAVGANCLDGLDGDYILGETDKTCHAEYVLAK